MVEALRVLYSSSVSLAFHRTLHKPGFRLLFRHLRVLVIKFGLLKMVLRMTVLKKECYIHHLSIYLNLNLNQRQENWAQTGEDMLCSWFAR